mmetsp:Transcript_18327/g.51068  ORF Transcript_18327/g.51068 Transcript_18327/m.51068 type:complete len:224 (+) Transcript_18327:1318-1989(+)
MLFLLPVSSLFRFGTAAVAATTGLGNAGERHDFRSVVLVGHEVPQTGHGRIDNVDGEPVVVVVIDVAPADVFLVVVIQDSENRLGPPLDGNDPQNVHGGIGGPGQIPQKLTGHLCQAVVPLGKALGAADDDTAGIRIRGSGGGIGRRQQRRRFWVRVGVGVGGGHRYDRQEGVEAALADDNLVGFLVLLAQAGQNQQAVLLDGQVVRVFLHAPQDNRREAGQQ